METWIDRENLYDGKLIQLQRGRVQLDDGQQALREVVNHPGGVAVVPVLEDDVVFVRQFRIAVDRDVLEIPAGKLEADDTLEERAQAELAEEIGFRAGRLVPIGHMLPSPGFLNETLHLFLAFDLSPVERNPDWDENIEIVRMPLASVRAMLRDHAFEDGKTRIGLHCLLDHLAENSP